LGGDFAPESAQGLFQVFPDSSSKSCKSAGTWMFFMKPGIEST